MMILDSGLLFWATLYNQSDRRAALNLRRRFKNETKWMHIVQVSVDLAACQLAVALLWRRLFRVYIRVSQTRRICRRSNADHLSTCTELVVPCVVLLTSVALASPSSQYMYAQYQRLYFYVQCNTLYINWLQQDCHSVTVTIGIS